MQANDQPTVTDRGTRLDGGSESREHIKRTIVPSRRDVLEFNALLLDEFKETVQSLLQRRRVLDGNRDIEFSEAQQFLVSVVPGAEDVAQRIE